MLPFKSERSTLYIELKIDENKEVDFKINWKEKSVQSLKGIYLLVAIYLFRFWQSFIAS